MATKDWISIVFSTMALLVSALSFYFSNIRIEDNALVRIANVHVQPGEKGDSANGYIKGFVTTQTALINAGNRPAIVLSAEYQLSDQPDLSNGGFGGFVQDNDQLFPLVLAPHELRIVELKIPIKHVVDNFKSGAQFVDENNRGDLRRLFAGFKISALDSTGALHDKWTGMQFAIDVSENQWAGLRGINRGGYPLTAIFR